MTGVLSLWKGVIDVRPPMARLCDAVARQYGVNSRDIRSGDRCKYLVMPRQDFMARARAAGFSTTQIGRFLGGRDHTTVIYGARRHAERSGALAL